MTTVFDGTDIGHSIDAGSSTGQGWSRKTHQVLRETFQLVQTLLLHFTYWGNWWLADWLYPNHTTKWQSQDSNPDLDTSSMEAEALCSKPRRRLLPALQLNALDFPQEIGGKKWGGGQEKYVLMTKRITPLPKGITLISSTLNVFPPKVFVSEISL